MNKQTLFIAASLSLFSLSVSANRYEQNKSRQYQTDSRSAVQGIHSQNKQPKKQQKYNQKRNYNNSYNKPNPPRNDLQRQGFNSDYRSNRHFDNSYVVTKPNYSKAPYNAQYRNYTNYSYGDWHHDSRRYSSQWQHRGHTYYHYQPYSHDRYRYRPVRGLGHYYERVGYGYGHWHEGYWCYDYHQPSYYVSYYSHYPYQNGWRVGDGDFGIWFSF